MPPRKTKVEENTPEQELTAHDVATAVAEPDPEVTVASLDDVLNAADIATDDPDDEVTDIDLEEQRQYQDAQKIVPVIPRKNIGRTKIGDVWYTFSKGVEIFVPKPVADHLAEKGVL